MNKKLKQNDYWVYILQCKNNSYYTGYTTNLHERFQAHLNGTGSKYTRSFKPISIAQYWQLRCEKGIAMKIERSIKNLSRMQKENLIASPWLIFEFFPSLMLHCKIVAKQDNVRKNLTHIMSLN